MWSGPERTVYSSHTTWIVKPNANALPSTTPACTCHMHAHPKSPCNLSTKNRKARVNDPSQLLHRPSPSCPGARAGSSSLLRPALTGGVQLTPSLRVRNRAAGAPSNRSARSTRGDLAWARPPCNYRNKLPCSRSFRRSSAGRPAAATVRRSPCGPRAPRRAAAWRSRSCWWRRCG